jgi:polyribonucleotide nucleotidyltransferase
MINDVVTSAQSGGFGNGQSSFGRSQGQGQGQGGFGGGSRGGFGFGAEGTLEMEIANRDVARVIGRGGSKIRELQDESSTRIQINKDRDNGVTTVVEIRGSEEGQQRAKQLIEDLTASQNSFEDGGFRNGDSRQGRGGGFGGRNDWAGDSLEIEVASKDVARIIGKGGSKIQEMQDKSGTRIKINKDRDDGVTTVVEIRGSKEGQQKAKQLIEELG